MKYVSKQEIFDEARACLEGRDREGNPKPIDIPKAEGLLNELLDHSVGNTLVLYTLGSLYLTIGKHGLAITLLRNVVDSDPKFGEAWNNLGLAYRSIGDWDTAAACVDRAVKYVKNPDIPCNMAGLYLNRNMPDEALRYAEAALEQDPSHVKAKWHKSLALLEKRQWAEAWELHDMRLQGGANEEIARRNYHGDEQTPMWDGKSQGTVVIHGEQGMGDEIMFASCIPDAMKTGAKIILEPSPRLEAIFKRSFPGCEVFGTNETDGRDWIEKFGKPDFKCPIGTLPKFYRRADEDFPGTPYIKANPALKGWWRQKILSLGRKPNIGITWQGGVHATRSDVRSFHPSLYAPLFKDFEANWISLQYDDTAQACVDELREMLGVKIQHWPKAVEQKDRRTGKQNNLEDLIALVANLDLVVSVCQTAIHVAGSLGIPTLCLTPSEPSWRYSAGDYEDMPWYASVKQLRQPKCSNDWGPVIQETYAHVGAFLQSINEAKEA